MQNIENLRKQAKRLVRWHREGHHPVAEIIRTHLPAYAKFSDLEILAATFRLADAQELIAKQQGFSNWKSMLEGVPMGERDHEKLQTEIEFKRAEPQLFVTDLARSLEFFTATLGFQTQFSYGEPAFYAQVARGQAYLNLRWVKEPLVDATTARLESFLAASICVESIKELFLEYQQRGVTFRQSLLTESWGARTFIVADPDGNLILFAE